MANNKAERDQDAQELEVLHVEDKRGAPEPLNVESTMAGTGKQPIDLYTIGEHLEFTDAREQAGGRRSEGVVTLAAGKDGPGAHIHTQQIEGFEVLSGTLVVIVDGQTTRLEAAPMVARFWYEPALNMEWMLQTMGERAMARGGAWKNVPLLVAAYMLFMMRKEYRLGGMPFWLQDVLFGLLAGVAVITGQAKKVPHIPGKL